MIQQNGNDFEWEGLRGFSHPLAFMTCCTPSPSSVPSGGPAWRMISNQIHKIDLRIELMRLIPYLNIFFFLLESSSLFWSSYIPPWKLSAEKKDENRQWNFQKSFKKSNYYSFFVSGDVPQLWFFFIHNRILFIQSQVRYFSVVSQLRKIRSYIKIVFI